MAPKYKGYDFLKTVLKSPKYIVAPMVDQSELAWRMLSRKYGAELCYTPMYHAARFVLDSVYRRDALQTCAEDRPLIVQFCANNPETFTKAALLAESSCDAIDLNIGCPQTIAKKGHYGAFLQDEWDLLLKMVSMASEKLSIPVTCKIRVFEDVQKTIEYAKMLERAGCQLLTVHGRTREQKGPNTGLASWDLIKTVRENVSIPVFANGNIQYLRDVQQCMECTGVDGVMSAEGNLSNPALFTGQQPPIWQMAEEYLALVEKYPCSLSYIRGHLFRLWHHILTKHTDMREVLGSAKTMIEMKKCCNALKERVLAEIEQEGDDSNTLASGLPYWRCQPYVRPSPKEPGAKRQLEECNAGPPNGESGACGNSCKTLSKKQKKKASKKTNIRKEEKWITCQHCLSNPRGSKCVFSFCRVCCKDKTVRDGLDCRGHRFWFKMRRQKDDTDPEKPSERTNDEMSAEHAPQHTTPDISVT